MTGSLYKKSFFRLYTPAKYDVTLTPLVQILIVGSINSLQETFPPNFW